MSPSTATLMLSSRNSSSWTLSSEAARFESGSTHSGRKSRRRSRSADVDSEGIQPLCAGPPPDYGPGAAFHAIERARALLDGVGSLPLAEFISPAFKLAPHSPAEALSKNAGESIGVSARSPPLSPTLVAEPSGPGSTAGGKQPGAQGPEPAQAPWRSISGARPLGRAC